MKKLTTLYALFISVTPLFADDKPVLADFYLNNLIIDGIQINAKQTSPFMHTPPPTQRQLRRGRMPEPQLVRPDITVTVNPKVLNSSDQTNGARISIQLSTDGTLSSGQSKRFYSVNVSNELHSSASQEVVLTPTEIKQGEFNQSTSMTPSISSGGLFRRAAGRIASNTVSEILPQEKANFESEMKSRFDSTGNEVEKTVNLAMKNALSFIDSKNPLPLSAKLTSTTGTNGNISLQLASTDPNQVKKQLPETIKDPLLATRAVVHADLFSEAIGKALEGKTLKLSELKTYFCSPQIEKLLDLCEPLKATKEEISITFEKKDPIKVTFENGKIGIRMNAVFKLGEEKARIPSVSSVPYTVDLIYRINGMGAERETIKVHAKDQVDPLKALEGHFSGNREKPNAPLFSQLFNKEIATEIETNIGKAFKPSIQIPTLDVPAQYQFQQGGLQLTHIRRLVPSEFRTDKGWLVLSTKFQ